MRGARPRLQRPSEGRLLGGVCAGLARAQRLDVTLARLFFLLLALASGLGLLVYGALWLVLPAEGGAGGGRFGGQPFRVGTAGMRSDLLRAARSARGGWDRLDRRPWPIPLSRRWIGLGLVGAGLILLLGSLGLFDWLTGLRALALATIALGGAALLSLAPHWGR